MAPRRRRLIWERLPPLRAVASSNWLTIVLLCAGPTCLKVPFRSSDKPSVGCSASSLGKAQRGIARNICKRTPYTASGHWPTTCGVHAHDVTSRCSRQTRSPNSASIGQLRITIRHTYIVQCLDRTDPADGTMSKAAKPAAFATGSGIAGAHPHNVRVANPASFPSPYKPAKQQRWIVPFRLVADGESGLVPQRMKR